MIDGIGSSAKLHCSIFVAEMVQSMRDIQQVSTELEAVHKEADELLRKIAIVTMKAIRERSNHHSQLNPFGPEMRHIDALLKDVYRPALRALAVKEKTVHSLAEDAISKPRTHGLIFFWRVVSTKHFEAATGIDRSKWRDEQDSLAYKAAVLSIELRKLKEESHGRENVEMVRV